MPEAQPLRAVFFDARDTLGSVDRPGHLVAFRPTTEALLEYVRSMGLKIGVITNLPDNISSEQGRTMVTSAILSEDPATGKVRTIGDYIPAANIITNHDVGVDKPDPRIYRKAAELIGVKPEEAMFCGENFPECLGAEAAGMRAQRKPFPVGQEFLPSLIQKFPTTKNDSGRAFEALFEHEHVLGERIFAAGHKIADALKAIDPKKPLPDHLRTAMGLFVYLINNFADQVHLRAEEAVVPLAVARGMDPRQAQWMLNDHAQVRAYWASVNIAWNRILTGDDRDREWAVEDFWRSIEAQVTLLDKHAIRENDEIFPLLGSFFDDGDDTMVMGILMQIGWANVGPFVTMVQQMEKALAASAPKAVAATPRIPIKGSAKARKHAKRAAARPRAAR
jgi:FMN phosphatase YigB (HAD superfamily)